MKLHPQLVTSPEQSFGKRTLFSCSSFKYFIWRFQWQCTSLYVRPQHNPQPELCRLLTSWLIYTCLNSSYNCKIVHRIVEGKATSPPLQVHCFTCVYKILGLLHITANQGYLYKNGRTKSSWDFSHIYYIHERVGGCDRVAR